MRFAQATGVRPDGLKEYDWKSEHVGLTSLSIENCVILANEYESVIKPAMEAHQPKKVTIEIGSAGQKKSFSLGYDGSSAFVQLALNVNENGATDASHVLTYKFAKKAIYDDMNVLTGEGTERAIESELLHFIEALKMAIFFGQPSMQYLQAVQRMEIDFLIISLASSRVFSSSSEAFGRVPGFPHSPFHIGNNSRSAGLPQYTDRCRTWEYCSTGRFPPRQCRDHNRIRTPAAACAAVSRRS